MRKSSTLSFLFILIPFTILQGHGLHIDIRLQSPVVIATIGYSENQPLADGVVAIYSPSDGSKAYQAGRSDRSGNFVFLPDAEGEWTISVDDQKGHAEKKVITIPAGFFTPGFEQQETEVMAHEHEHEEMPLTLKIVIGLALIFGITGFFYGYQAKRSAKK